VSIGQARLSGVKIKEQATYGRRGAEFSPPPQIGGTLPPGVKDSQAVREHGKSAQRTNAEVGRNVCFGS